MEQRCQVVLFSSAGKKCFGSILTPEARRALAQYRAYEAAVHAAAEELFPRFFPGNHSPAADSPPS